MKLEGVMEFILVERVSKLLRFCTQGDLYCYILEDKGIKVLTGGRHATDAIITCTGLLQCSVYTIQYTIFHVASLDREKIILPSKTDQNLSPRFLFHNINAEFI